MNELRYLKERKLSWQHLEGQLNQMGNYRNLFLDGKIWYKFGDL